MQHILDILCCPKVRFLFLLHFIAEFEAYFSLQILLRRLNKIGIRNGKKERSYKNLNIEQCICSI